MTENDTVRMDPNSVRAAELFGVELDKVTDEQRRAAKEHAVENMVHSVFTEDEIMPFDGPAPWGTGALRRNKLWAHIYVALYLENYYGQK